MESSNLFPSLELSVRTMDDITFYSESFAKYQTWYSLEIIYTKSMFNNNYWSNLYICYLSTAKGSKVDASQEMIAIGTTNIIGSFVSAYPATGSFARTAINAASGVRTQMNGLFTGILSLNLCIRSRISIAKSHNSTCNNFLM